MRHLDPDRLVLLALSEEPAGSDESAHLDGCPDCRTELDELRHVALLGAETQDVRDLPPPPPRVWAGIAAATTTAPIYLRPRRRWAAPVLAAAAAVVLAVGGTVALDRWINRAPAQPITAKASLTRLATAPVTARGDAEVLGGADLRLGVHNLPLTTGYYQVWLIDPDDTTKMMSMGNLPTAALSGAEEAVLPLPPGADLNRYRLVDISAEAYDGDAAHSGKSLLRGTLTN